MSKGRKCNKAYWEVEQGLTNDPCFFVYNGVCWKDDGPCPMPKKPKTKAKGKMDIKQANFITMVHEATGLTVVAEHRFHEKRMWRFDYAILEAKVAVEVEGGVFIGGRHTRGAGFAADLEKYNTAESMGWHVLRITPDVLCAPVTIELIKKTVDNVIYLNIEK